MAGRLFAKQLIREETYIKVINTLEETIDDSASQALCWKTLCDILEYSGQPALEEIAAKMDSPIDSKIFEYVFGVLLLVNTLMYT